jgi:hypothetical protein
VAGTHKLQRFTCDLHTGHYTVTCIVIQLPV